LIAPADDSRESALALGDQLRPPAEQREPVGETLRDLLRREGPQPRRGELERERQAVETLAQLRDRREGLVVQLEVAARSRPFHEEMRRVGVGQRRDLETDSPGTPSGSRLVASRRTPGHDERSAAASSPAAAVTCSQLSSTSSSSRRCR
jgi:hypothetical protein